MATQIIEKSTTKVDLSLLKKTSVNVLVFGHGLVGSAFIDQLIKEQELLFNQRDIDIKIIAIANSKSILLNRFGVSENWREAKLTTGKGYDIDEIIAYLKAYKFDNLIAIDNTADAHFVSYYKTLIEHECHLVSSNKKGNTQSLEFYRELRTVLAKNNKRYLYETNVGAGLPLIDTIALLHASGENITKIRGVFSGSLSYLFNTFSTSQKPFSDILQQAIDKGFTEPDPREDLGGEDVARKLLILARELELDNELEDVKVENLIPKNLRKISNDQFLNRLTDLDVPYYIKRKNISEGNVLRYVAQLSGDLSKNNGAKLEVKLEQVSKNTVLGQLKDSDTIFEIYTENYGKNPIVIQGAGAGAAVTARGVFGDVLRLCSVFK